MILSNIAYIALATIVIVKKALSLSTTIDSTVEYKIAEAHTIHLYTMPTMS